MAGYKTHDGVGVQEVMPHYLFLVAHLLHVLHLLQQDVACRSPERRL